MLNPLALPCARASASTRRTFLAKTCIGLRFGFPAISSAVQRIARCMLDSFPAPATQLVWLSAL
jgi:hypothetical protein